MKIKHFSDLERVEETFEESLVKEAFINKFFIDWNKNGFVK